MGLIKKALVGAVLYTVLYFLVLGLSPRAFTMYLNMFAKYDHTVSLDQPMDITNVREVFGVHSFAEAEKYRSSNEVLIFRNFSDCAAKFESTLYPRHKDQTDTYITIETQDYSGNAYVAAVTKGEVVDMTLEETINNKSPNVYASFLRIFDAPDYSLLLNAGPEFKFKFDSSFISFFKKPLVSTPIHAAPIAATYSVQCYGVKSWLFWSSRTLNEHGHSTVAHPAGGVITGSPESILRIPTLRAVVHPNDMLTFPPMYYHAVMSSAGKNIMFAIRRIDGASAVASLMNAPKDTVFWFLRYMYDSMNGARKKKSGFFHSKEKKAFQDEYKKVVDKQRELFSGFDDTDMWEL